MTNTTVGWLGTGEMGGRIVRRLAEQGHDVVAWNRTRNRAEPLEQLGVTIVESPREVAENSTVVCSMLTNAAAVREVVLGSDGLAEARSGAKILVDMSTIGPDDSRSISEAFSQTGGRMLDCPVSGGVGAVATGDLSVMVAGERAAFDEVRPILDTIGKRVTYMGGSGKALTMKIAINVSLAVQLLAFSEGVLLAELNGVARADAVEAMTNSAIASANIRHRAKAVLPGGLPDPAWFNCNMMQKDLLMALTMGRASKLQMPTTALVNEWMNACRGSGVEDQDFSVVFHVLARQAGVATDLFGGEQS